MPSEHHIEIRRTARYFTQGNATDPAEIWLALHGYGQLAERFIARFAPLDDGRRLVVAPEGLSRFYVQGTGIDPESKVGASWMTREDRLSEIADYIRYLDAVHDEVRGRIRGDRARLVVLGFSQGTATASRWAVSSRAPVDRLVLWAGPLPPEVGLRAEAPRLNALDLTLVAGEKDDDVMKGLPEQRKALDGAGIRYRVVTFAGGHAIDAGALEELTGR
jgi:predicted esterase